MCKGINSRNYSPTATARLSPECLSEYLVCVMLMCGGHSDWCWINVVCGPTLYILLPLPLFIWLMIGIKTWENKPRSLHLLLSACQQESLFNSAPLKLSQSNPAQLMCMKEQHWQSNKIQDQHFLHVVLLVNSYCPFFCRPVPGALLPMPRGALGAAGPAGGQAGTAWVVRRHSNVRSGSLGNDGRSCPGRAAPARTRGKAEEKEEAGWWRMMKLLWPGRIPCRSRREGPGTAGWSPWRLGAPWICPLTLCCR